MRADLASDDLAVKRHCNRIQTEVSSSSATADSGMSKREMREIENQQTIGGLRNPLKAVTTSAELRSTGVRLRSVLQPFISAEVIRQFEADPTISPFGSDLLESVQQALALEFSAAVLPISGYQNDIIAKVLQSASDPDSAVIPNWLNEGFPLGINCPIPHTNVFPKTEDVSEAIKISARMGNRMEDWDGTATNYSSFVEAGQKAQQEVQRIVDEGWARVFDTWQEAVDCLGERAQLTPVACVVKEAHGREKIRLVVDMRRSAVNGQMDVRERVVLPRVSDVAEGVRSLVAKSDNPVEFLCCDFKDAFLTMKLHELELPHVLIKDSCGRYINYLVAAFGLASAPLIWCRLAAMSCRLAQACVLPGEARLRTYVDDPIISVSGPSKSARSLPMCIVLLLWCALGFKLSWGKAIRGHVIDWIGVSLEVSDVPVKEMTVSLSPDKCAKLKSVLQELLQSSVVPVAKLRYAAGLLGWLSGIVVEARPWLAMLWAALIQTEQYTPKRDTTRRRKGLVFRKQISHACTVHLAAQVTGDQDSQRQPTTSLPVSTSRPHVVRH